MNKILTCVEANQYDLVSLLEKLGHRPTKIRGNDHWYLSPIRTEKTASFKINRSINCWFDHGLGKGGKVVDFCLLYFNSDIRSVLDKLSNELSSDQLPRYETNNHPAIPGTSINIINQGELTSIGLLRYLRQRKISERVARKYCHEVSFDMKDKRHRAIGFLNNKGGYELRNSWFKGSSSPKSFTVINNGNKRLAIFEGFFDFLSLVTIAEKQHIPDFSFLVLNSVSFLTQASAVMHEHDKLHLFLDNDTAGRKATAIVIASHKNCVDESGLYLGYNDLNEWMQHIGKQQNKQQRLKM